ncbi:hypothetical protein EDD17DRAFT_1571644 [Pisolithus thermaeus]|nr:hypothetical protein EV401DRAFT_879363 [Pisolithus croceorrhizus]KAI6163175.1 hypothetical protein EDD17DRAFT_1571644 [Pisolithus thermaeus]
MNAYHSPHLPPRRSHRKCFSVSRLSSETVQTLPEYSSPPPWAVPVEPLLLEGEESDRPPDYPSAVDEADADTGDCNHSRTPTKRRSASHARRRKRALPPRLPMDPFLDTLLERSVHALELSNALLQSSMSTQTSLSTLLSPAEIEPDRTLEVRARNLSTRIRVNSGLHATWMDHLEEISEDVDKLLDDSVPSNDESAVSRSLPTSTPSRLRHRRKPSLLELNGASSSSSQLQYSLPARDKLVARAPRALTQYVESSTDPELIILPSTLGVRSFPSTHSANLRNHLPAPPTQTTPSHPSSSPSENKVDTPLSAYHLLTNLVKRSEVSSQASPRLFGLPSGRRSTGASSTERGSTVSSPSSVRTIRSSTSDRCRPRTRASTLRSRSVTPERQAPLALRSTTPPIEAPSVSSSESTTSSDHPTGYLAMQSLRKILEKQSSSVSMDIDCLKGQGHRRTRSFQPVTPPPPPVLAASSATASVSRLFTKGRHSLSTRSPSPPAHSSLKVRSVPPTPAPSPSSVSLADLFGNGVAKAFGSSPSSGTNTPKRISFAELPESYSSLRPGNSKLRIKRGKRKSKVEQRKAAEGESSGWLQAWLGVGPSPWRSQEERIEERMTRGWGARPGYGTIDDWAV